MKLKPKRQNNNCVATLGHKHMPTGRMNQIWKCMAESLRQASAYWKNEADMDMHAVIFETNTGLLIESIAGAVNLCPKPLPVYETAIPDCEAIEADQTLRLSGQPGISDCRPRL